MRRIDCHVHLVGDGTSGSGCWIRLRSMLHKLQARLMLKGAGISGVTPGKGLDEAYAAALKGMVESAPSLDAVCLLAQDIPYTDSGEALPEKGGFYVPNEYLFSVVDTAPGLFIPTVSIHPGKPGAMEELEACIEKGGKLLKLLPNCLNVDCSHRKYQKFWERIAEAGILFLSHTGGEMTLPVLKPEYANPENLVLPLECGVTVIAAHCAGRSGLRDPDYTEILLGMFDKYPNLYGDNSAFSGFNRCRTAARVLQSEMTGRILHGSDFPIPVTGLGLCKMGLISKQDHKKAASESNPLERDCIIKKAMGFDEASFTKVGELLAGQA
ncbi:MAG: amidohydrolase family protein [Verrucomicrobiales bacterium]|nr:amidohydrolase family protein [Verrucomicrobiales bacterium]